MIMGAKGKDGAVLNLLVRRRAQRIKIGNTNQKSRSEKLLNILRHHGASGLLHIQSWFIFWGVFSSWLLFSHHLFAGVWCVAFSIETKWNAVVWRESTYASWLVDYEFLIEERMEWPRLTETIINCVQVGVSQNHPRCFLRLVHYNAPGNLSSESPSLQKRSTYTYQANQFTVIIWTVNYQYLMYIDWLNACYVCHCRIWMSASATFKLVQLLISRYPGACFKEAQVCNTLFGMVSTSCKKMHLLTLEAGCLMKARNFFNLSCPVLLLTSNDRLKSSEKF